MAIRDLIVLTIVFISLPVCFARPWIGILVFSWLGYMNPHKYSWTIAYDFPVAQIVAIPTILGFILTKGKERFPLEREVIIIILLWIIFTFTSFSAFYPEYAWDLWQKTSKIFLMSLITIPLFIDRRRLRYLLLTIGLSLGLLGVKGSIFTLVTGGRWNVRGPDSTFIAGEGDFGLALNMTLPILLYLAKGEDNKKLRLLLYSSFVLSIVSVIFTYRRGAFLGLAAVIFLLAVKSKKKVIAAALLSLVLIVAPFFITEKWSERMGTITTYEEDASAMGRINAWKMAWNVAKDRPLNGSGFEGLKWATVIRYSPNPDLTAGDVHSIYFEILGEHGFLAFGLFMLLLLYSFTSLRRINKNLAGIPSSDWIRNYSDMLQVSLAAFMVGGVFLGRAYFDLFYHLVAIVVILKILARREVSLNSSENSSIGLKS